MEKEKEEETPDFIKELEGHLESIRLSCLKVKTSTEYFEQYTILCRAMVKETLAAVAESEEERKRALEDADEYFDEVVMLRKMYDNLRK